MKDGRFRPKKRFGQNFLHDRGIAARIVDAAGIAPGDAVVELGPGRGVLTRLIAERGARLIALELDRGLVDELRAEFAGSPRVEIVSADFTKVSLGALLSERGLNRCVLIGNIPYHLTRDVLFDFLVDEYGTISRAVIMVQREVGDRIASKPGSRSYGIPSVVLQSLYEIDVVARAGAGAFQPPPKVASIVLAFRPLSKPLLAPDDVRPFIALVRGVFQQRRKTVQKSLRACYSLSEESLARIQDETGIDLRLRPEALSKEAFLALSRSLPAVRTS
ncbi:MAG TPA: 16S rRNA (adenine(1518)-N(6)/adenine(1519)-N(6))-dimethyltransferase RsmA [Candidatus Krumholzibacteria bacterium]|nr:16S rRNA (adenine(1518)-N(6)/adenine(1519)-N(6))-dimethyltransferase RsmA [Candidatus Krumholzibacteria bacterium]